MAHSEATEYYEVERSSIARYKAATEFVSSWHPTTGNQVDVEPKVNVTAFGDGYELRTVDGINNQKQVWNLTFEGTPEYIGEIDKFLKAKGGHQAFYWITPDHSRMSEGTAGNLEPSYYEYDRTPPSYVKGDDLTFRYIQQSGNFYYFEALNITGYPRFELTATEYTDANSKLASALKFNTTNIYYADITGITNIKTGLRTVGYNMDLKITGVRTGGATDITSVTTNNPTFTARDLPTIVSPAKQDDAYNIESHRIKVVCRKWSRTRNPGWQQLTCTFEQVFEY